MSGYIYIWLLWILWCVVTFYMDKSYTRTIYGLTILTLITTSPYQLIVFEIPINISTLFLLGLSIVLLVYYRFPIKQYVYIFFICYLFVIYFLWKLTSPIVSEALFYFFGVLIGYLVLKLASKSFAKQVVIWSIGMSLGQILYNAICSSYYLLYGINSDRFFLLYTLVLILLVLHYVWRLFLIRVENLVKWVEVKKKWIH
ncbi:hypothetical protein [Gracilibacillus sp. YIM 98692]|uniref:YphA family membrane protein n=1 Tax=Gracilibacillus sp. YIM 98692 TaxID=2663532 RepID=UPI0013D340E2|nr:hypothetical protein [Gracilibacillus sp. YIM 98692]